MDIGRKLQNLEARLARVERSPRLSHASIDATSVEVRDSTGSLRGLLGVQADGTAAVNIVNGPPPPQPSVPVVASVIGGITVSWDGTFTGGAVLPLDWQRVEVHASATTGFTPEASTLQGTIETPQGSTVVVVTDDPVYVRLLARTTSGIASTPSDQVGPLGPTPVVADDLVDGIVTEVKLANQAVSAAKVKLGAIGSDQLALGVGNMAPDPSFEGAFTAQLIEDEAAWTLVTPGNNSAKALHLDCTSGGVTWKSLHLARYPVLPGERHYLALDYRVSATFDGTGAKMYLRYQDATGTTTGWGVASEEPPVLGGAWRHVSVAVTAPANTVAADLFLEGSQVTQGEAWFDNVAMHTLVTAGMIAANAITANEIAANSIQTGHLVALAVSADKIGAAAVTTAKLDALAVTADKIAANAITVGKINAGAVDATALAADAITGKTITGGTITGTVLQTDTTGERITLNEADANKVLVYNSSGTIIGELSALGLLVKGTNGALLWLDPNNTFPNLRLTSADQSTSAVINISGTSALLGMNSGLFTSAGNTDWKWRTLFGASSGTEVWAAERVRDADVSVRLGGRIFLDASHATFGYSNSANSSQDALLYITQNLAQLLQARLELTPPASSSSALSVNAASGYTGNLLRLLVNSTEKFKVDKDGKLTASNIAAGRVTVSPVANTPTSATVTGLNLTGTVRVVATPNTSLPGTQVTGVGVNNVTSTGFTVWLTRTNTTSTGVDWIAIGE